jgi:ketopantoate reductase
MIGRCAQRSDGRMKFCVYGAGAIGGYLVVELALSGHEVCVVARGATQRRRVGRGP